jgi:uncharacterized protein YbjQ (UPF0145 family)
VKSYPPYEGSVRIFHKAPQEQYVEIGKMFALSQTATESDLIEALRHKAASLGANGIVIVETLESQRTVGVSTREKVWWKPVIQRKIAAIAVRFE